LAQESIEVKSIQKKSRFGEERDCFAAPDKSAKAPDNCPVLVGAAAEKKGSPDKTPEGTGHLSGAC
jgi:hypothetical protein